MSAKRQIVASSVLRAMLAISATILLGNSQPLSAEMDTLFSTPQERNIIDSNRYKSDVVIETQVTEETTEEPVELIQEELRMSYKVSGITLSNSGPHFVWINNEVYEDGQRLEDDSQIKVMSGSKIQIRITAPDGKIYYANSGETVEVTYLVTVNKQ